MHTIHAFVWGLFSLIGSCKIHVMDKGRVEVETKGSASMGVK